MGFEKTHGGSAASRNCRSHGARDLSVVRAGMAERAPQRSTAAEKCSERSRSTLVRLTDPGWRGFSGSFPGAGNRPERFPLSAPLKGLRKTEIMAATKRTARQLAVLHLSTPHLNCGRPEMSVTGRSRFRVGAICDNHATVKLPISPLVGEMAGRPEGGAVPPAFPMFTSWLQGATPAERAGHGAGIAT